ncbi:hypothetical protein ACQ4PT_066292 [Festuca glaucescens]
MAASPHDDDDMSEIVISSLPLETRWPPFLLRQYGGFWMPESFLPGVAAAHTRFKPRPSDVLLASFPKSGTTWLKALAFATLNRVKHPPRHPDHPLRRCNPHDCVKYLEWDDHGDVLEALPSPRVLATHIPYTLLPARITAVEGSGGRIVYICRDPKDALVSLWFFIKKKLADEANTMEEAFELFCDGRTFYGPQWHHVVGYWEQCSRNRRRRPEEVLFLRYEDMLRDPVGNVRKLAEFMGCAFSGDEEAAGVVQDIVAICSMDTLKNMEGNKSGSQRNFRNETFYRKGVAGDWSNHLTPAMAERLDKIAEDALRGSGFTFAAGRQAVINEYWTSGRSVLACKGMDPHKRAWDLMAEAEQSRATMPKSEEDIDDNIDDENEWPFLATAMFESKIEVDDAVY